MFKTNDMHRGCTKWLFLVLLISALFVPGSGAQKLRLASPFTEHMVLQRDRPINIWGEAEAYQQLKVKLGEDSLSVVADANGYWQAVLSPMPAGGPFEFSVQCVDQEIRMRDVLVGEVWICSGQSNMQMGYQQIPDIKALEPLACNIRTFKVQQSVAFKEQKYLEGTWETKNPPSAVAFAFAYHLQEFLDVPVGIMLTSWGSSSIEGWMPRDMTEKLPHFKRLMNDFDSDMAKHTRIDSILSKKGKRTTKDDIYLRTQPNILYNAMLHPLAPYSCRGIVWYQGEANSKTIEGMQQYGTTLPLWIERIRTEWKNNQLEVMAVMLPGFENPLIRKNKQPDKLELPDLPSWAWMREAQCQALDLGGTHIITTIDLGETRNIHPKDKLPIGQRLALVAQQKPGKKKQEAQGPIINRVTIKNNKLVLHFDNAKGLQTIDGTDPKAFWLADQSGDWYKANSKIKGGKVELGCHQLERPLYVRYAFSAMPEVNLINGAGLPARPFRTDLFLPPANK